VTVLIPLGSPSLPRGFTAQAIWRAVRPLESVASASSGAAAKNFLTAATSQHLVALKRAVLEGGFIHVALGVVMRYGLLRRRTTISGDESPLIV
jgi:hypothetical protein